MMTTHSAAAGAPYDGRPDLPDGNDASPKSSRGQVDCRERNDPLGHRGSRSVEWASWKEDAWSFGEVDLQGGEDTRRRK